MTTSRIYYSVPLAPGEVAAHAIAKTDVGQSLAGRDRHLWEMATGASAVVDEPASVERNPQGLIGIDMSGPPFGPCLLLPVAWWEGRSGAGVSAPSIWSAIAGSKASTPWRIYNRPHRLRLDGNAPLQKLALLWRGTASAGTSSVFRCTVANLSNGATTSFDRTINTTTTTDYDEATLFPFVPENNDIVMTWQRISGTRTLEMHSMTFAVAVKRQHGLSFPG
jgi:hypothetical protein